MIFVASQNGRTTPPSIDRRTRGVSATSDEDGSLGDEIWGTPRAIIDALEPESSPAHLDLAPVVSKESLVFRGVHTSEVDTALTTTPANTRHTRAIVLTLVHTVSTHCPALQKLARLALAQHADSERRLRRAQGGAGTQRSLQSEQRKSRQRFPVRGPAWWNPRPTSTSTGPVWGVA
jgi:hypothetical protein